MQPTLGQTPSATPPSPAYGARIRQVQIDALRRSFPFALAGSLISACFSAYALRGVLPMHEVLAWIVATLLVGALRLAAMIAYDRHLTQPDAAARWVRRMLVGNLASGLLWGLPFAYWTLFVPLEYQLFFIVILFGLGTGAIYSNYMLLPVMYAFEVPAFAPMFIALAAQPSAIHLALVTGGLAYLVATLAFIHRMNRTHLDALRLGYENLALLEQVRQEKIAAERSDLEKSRFLAAASHDLRQPVHAVNLFLGLLANEPLSRHGHYLVDNIGSAMTAMGQLFDALLNLSRLDAGVIEPRWQGFALNPLLDQLRAEYAPQAREKGMSLRVRPCAACIWSDPVLLERILRNLISNAITHATGGRVLIGCRRVGGQLRVEVWDNGVGIPAAEQERVFWEFHQLGNPERDRSKGLGLGLAIVRRTARLLGHPLALRSQAGQGTVFMLTAPIADPAQAGMQAIDAAPLHARATTSDAPLHGQLALLVDDDPQNLAGLTMLFESWGCRVIGASSGNALFERVLPLTERPALIVSDYRLRDHETGIHVIERLREEYNDPDLPALLVSGDTDPARLAEAADRAIPLLHKPVSVQALRERVAALLQATTARPSGDHE
ncbi:hybrid sensor histidine kinase/response regulator [Achromobacter piechaudii]|uniref:histidine kinase n=1 Tax=Achromobacter piechaudii ATCC 43553 TaxID=742159 RepID=D4XII4_9BURK|nr:hybrid sensor histidine kinase/response regulator [Achromobacter piechaudii]EFF73352.1 ATPase/histidine kinase/DNA gyrase B/HSP90 domain protein [Achromobacter piechaudii ATCC 43553]